MATRFSSVDSGESTALQTDQIRLNKNPDSGKIFIRQLNASMTRLMQLGSKLGKSMHLDAFQLMQKRVAHLHQEVVKDMDDHSFVPIDLKPGFELSKKLHVYFCEKPMPQSQEGWAEIYVITCHGSYILKGFKGILSFIELKTFCDEFKCWYEQNI